jgi:O-antigen ligase
MALLQAVTLGLVALIIAPGLLFYFDVTPKLAALLLGAAIAAPLAAARPPRRAVSVLVVLYAASLAISASVSAHPGLSWFGSNWRRYGAVTQIALLLFAWAVAAGANRRVILRVIALVTGLVSLYGMAQFAGFDPLLPSSAYHVGEGVWTIVRLPATFGYVSYFATWLAMAAFLALMLAAMEDGLWRRAAQAIAALACVALAMTGSRAAWLGFFAGAVVWLYRRGFRLPRRAWMFVVGALVVGAAFYLSPAGLSMRARTRWFVEDPWGGARPTLWRDSLRMGLAKPFLGYGPEGFTAEFPHYESVALAQAYPDFAHESPHNIFLDAFIAQGIIGVILLGTMAWLGLRAAWRAPHPGFAAALAAGLVSQQFTVFTIPTAALTFGAIALALDPVPDMAPRRWRWVALAPVAIALLYCAGRYTLADAALARTQNHLKEGRIGAAASAYGDYTRLRFPGTSADLWHSRALFELAGRIAEPRAKIDAVAQAGAAALAATATAEDPFDAWYNAAQMAAARNDAPGTERALRAAIAAHPRWFKPHWTLAQLLAMSSRAEEARNEAVLAVQLNAGKHPEVERTLAEILRGAPFQR